MPREIKNLRCRGRAGPVGQGIGRDCVGDAGIVPRRPRPHRDSERSLVVDHHPQEDRGRRSGLGRREDLGLAAEIPANGTFGLLSPREAIVAVQDYVDYYWLWSDLWRVDLETGSRSRMTASISRW